VRRQVAIAEQRLCIPRRQKLELAIGRGQDRQCVSRTTFGSVPSERERAIDVLTALIGAASAGE
jgi:hypothetical protein